MKGAPVIGIIPVVDSEGKISLQKTYTDSVFASGGIPLVIPYTANEEYLSHLLDMCDGYLFTGGVDINPAIYGEAVREECGEIQNVRDESELRLFGLIIKSGSGI